MADNERKRIPGLQNSKYLFLSIYPDFGEFNKSYSSPSLFYQLTRQMEVLNDRTVVANANLKADMERWHKTKQRDVKEILSTLADRQIRYYERVGQGFVGCIRDLLWQKD